MTKLSPAAMADRESMIAEIRARVDQASLVAHMRAHGRNDAADRLAALSGREFRQWQREFIAAHVPELESR